MASSTSATMRVDRHLAERSQQNAIIWEGDEPGTTRTISYGELHAEVVRMANCLKALGASKGDRITLYLPMIPEAAVAMLACARIGAVHSVVFGGFSPEALHGRLEDCRQPLRDHRRRRQARRQTDPAQGQCRRGDRAWVRRSMPCSSSAISATRSGSRAAATTGMTSWARPCPTVPLRADGRGGPALHPLHLRLDRKAQGRPAHHRRLFRVGRHHLPLCLRLPGRRDLLVHRRRGLGHRPQLRRLRSAAERRDHPDVRGRAELSGFLPLLGRSSSATRSTSSTPPRPRSAR